MVIALLLAQLVLPSAPSGPIQPPGMICASGGCEGGPVVYRTSQRGRLVVACDFLANGTTCSDREVTVTRSTPVPCEVEPGVYPYKGVDEACISWRGLDIKGPNTSYLGWGADFSKWVKIDSTVEPSSRGYVVSGTQGNSRIQQLLTPEAGTFTFSCAMRTLTPDITQSMRVYQENASGGGFCNPPLTIEFGTRSCTQTVTGTPTTMAMMVYTSTGSVEIAGCWLPKEATPGRECWADSDAVVHCDGERVTISTEGWPTEAGEISISFTYGPPSDGTNAYIFDPRPSGGSSWLLIRRSDGALQGGTSAGTQPTLGAGIMPREAPYQLRLKPSEGEVAVYLDGSLIGTWTGALSMGTETTLGTRGVGGDHINGSLRSLTVRSYE